MKVTSASRGHDAMRKLAREVSTDLNKPEDENFKTEPSKQAAGQ